MGKTLIIDNFSTGSLSSVSSLKNVYVEKGSVADAIFITKVINDFQPNYVIHAAASYQNPNDWKQDTETNVLGSVKHSFCFAKN